MPDFQQNYFELFGLPVAFELDRQQLGVRFRQLQQELHPDRYAGHSPQEQRLAVQYSALVNQAHATLRRPLSRALYLLELQGMNQEQVSAQQIDGGFLIEQMELREKLESIRSLVEPETVLDHLVTEIAADIKVHQNEFAQAYAGGALGYAAAACVKMQYLDKLQAAAEQLESELIDGIQG